MEREGHAVFHRSAVHGPHAASVDIRNKKVVRKNATVSDGMRVTDLLALEGKWDGTGEPRESCDLLLTNTIEHQVSKVRHAMARKCRIPRRMDACTADGAECRGGHAI